MSDREKKLVILFGLAAFVLVNFFGISWFQGQKHKVERDLAKAKNEVVSAEAAAGSFDTVYDEMKWLNDKMPSPKAGQLVSTELETYASNQATTNSLTVVKRDLKPNDETGKYFHRAKVQYKVSGREDALYRWLDRLQMPDQFKAITFLRLAPDPKDDTLIEATVDIEQWYVPLVDGSNAAPEEAPESSPEATPAPAPGATPAPAPGATPAPSPEATPAPTPENIQPPGTE
jgi:hypothetical protein